MPDDAMVIGGDLVDARESKRAEKGSWPEVMCATEDGLKPETLYGPTKRMEMVGAIGECSLEDHVLERDMAAKLWALSAEKTELSWDV